MEWLVGENSAFESFVGVNFWTMLFAWINLLILYFFLKKLLFGPVKKMIDDRQNEVDEMFESAETDRDDAKKLKAEYEEKLDKANEESEEILRSAIRRAQLKEEEILKEVGVKADRVIERAEEKIEQEKKRAINEVKNEVSGMAIGIASAIIARDVSEDEHKDLIDSFIDGIGDGE